MALSLFLFAPLVVLIGFIATLYIRYRYLKSILHKAKTTGRKIDHEVDVIIVGAGLAGSAMATMLARDGRKVLLIDKSEEPQPMFAGQTWMAGGVQALKDLGVEKEVNTETLEGTPDKNITLISKTGDVVMPGKTINICARNEKSVELFRKLAFAEKNCKFILGKVKSLLKNEEGIIGVELEKTEKEESDTIFKAPLTIIADGKNSWFRKVCMDLKPKAMVYCVGIEISKFLSGYKDKIAGVGTPKGPLFIFRPSPRETAFLSLCSEPHDLEQLKAFAGELMPDGIGEVYLEALARFPVLPRANGYYMPAVGHFVPGVMCIGDALNLRDPITASGMNMAMRDVKLLRDLLQDVPDLADQDAMYAAVNVFCIARKKYILVNDLGAHFFCRLMAPSNEGTTTLNAGYGDYFSKLNDENKAFVFALFNQTNRSVSDLFSMMYSVLLHSMQYSLQTKPLLQGLSSAAAAFLTFHHFVFLHLWYELRSSYALKGKPGL